MASHQWRGFAMPRLCWLIVSPSWLSMTNEDESGMLSEQKNSHMLLFDLLYIAIKLWLMMHWHSPECWIPSFIICWYLLLLPCLGKSLCCHHSGLLTDWVTERTPALHPSVELEFIAHFCAFIWSSIALFKSMPFTWCVLSLPYGPSYCTHPVVFFPIFFPFFSSQKCFALWGNWTSHLLFSFVDFRLCGLCNCAVASPYITPHCRQSVVLSSKSPDFIELDLGVDFGPVNFTRLHRAWLRCVFWSCKFNQTSKSST